MADAALSSTLDRSGHTDNTSPTRHVEADGIRFAYRRFGNPVGTPIVLLQHFMGNLDNYDPAITAAKASGAKAALPTNRHSLAHHLGFGSYPQCSARAG